jgi:hypothetical protein
MVPVAPALFSITNGCFSFSERRGPMARAIWSVEPPAGN